MEQSAVDILMYHSISDRGGPTSIAPRIFKEQMAALASSGRPVVGMDTLLGQTWPARAVVVTFDDAFQDFADAAWPVLKEHGFPALVYVPTGRVGASENWVGALTPPRPLMDWTTIRQLAIDGVTFGNHTISHPDLTSLDEDALERELSVSRSVLEQELGQSVTHFAPPYGKSSPLVRQAVAKRHATSVGTSLGQAEKTSDIYDLPRVEMFYFQSPGTWKRHLEGKGTAYLALRRTLRGIRNAVSHPARRG